MQLDKDGDIITLKASPTMATIVRDIPGARHNAQLQRWEFPLSPATCVIARGILGASLEVSPELLVWAHAEFARIKDVMAARAIALGEDDRCPTCGSRDPEYGPGCFDSWHTQPTESEER